MAKKIEIYRFINEFENEALFLRLTTKKGVYNYHYVLDDYIKKITLHDVFELTNIKNEFCRKIGKKYYLNLSYFQEVYQRFKEKNFVIQGHKTLNNKSGFTKIVLLILLLSNFLDLIAADASLYISLIGVIFNVFLLSKYSFRFYQRKRIEKKSMVDKKQIPDMLWLGSVIFITQFAYILELTGIWNIGKVISLFLFIKYFREIKELLPIIFAFLLIGLSFSLFYVSLLTLKTFRVEVS